MARLKFSNGIYSRFVRCAAPGKARCNPMRKRLVVLLYQNTNKILKLYSNLPQGVFVKMKAASRGGGGGVTRTTYCKAV